jgi:D-alanine-D-alanine ligase
VAVVALALDEVTGRGDERPGLAPEGEGPAPVDAVAALVRALGHRVEVVRVGYRTLARLEALAVDVALDLTDGIGRDGEPGVEVGELLRRRGVPVTGATPEARLLGDDKGRMRARLAKRGLPVAPGLVVADSAESQAEVEGAPGEGPWVLKPREGGGGVGVEVVRERGALAGRVAAALAVYGALVLESFVDGPELSVTLLSGRALPAVAIDWWDDDVAPHDRVLGFVAKHDPDNGPEWGIQEPPPLPADEVAAAEALAGAAWAAVSGPQGPRGLGRVDLRRGPTGWVVLDVNPAPAFQPTLLRADQGLVATALRAGGVSYLELVRRLLAEAVP